MRSNLLLQTLTEHNIRSRSAGLRYHCTPFTIAVEPFTVDSLFRLRPFLYIPFALYVIRCGYRSLFCSAVLGTVCDSCTVCCSCTLRVTVTVHALRCSTRSFRSLYFSLSISLS